MTHLFHPSPHCRTLFTWRVDQSSSLAALRAESCLSTSFSQHGSHPPTITCNAYIGGRGEGQVLLLSLAAGRFMPLALSADPCIAAVFFRVVYASTERATSEELGS